jgi:hypothetical protein
VQITQKASGHITSNLGFCILCDLGVTSISLLGCAQCGSHNMCAGTHFTKLVFLHLVGSAGRIVRAGVCGVTPQNVTCWMMA